MTRTKTTEAAAPGAPSMNFAPIPGYDWEKLTDPEHVGPGKYNKDVKRFSQALAATGAPPTKEGLKQLTDWLNANGTPVIVDNDRISFDGGKNWIDVQSDFGGENSTWTFQDPRGSPGAFDANGTWIANTGGGGPGGGGLPGFGGPGGGPGDDINQIYEDALKKLAAKGFTSMGEDVSKTLMDLLRGGKSPDLTRSLVAAREAEGAGMRGQLSDARAQLADRGLISESGVQQGSEVGAIQRLTENLAGPYSQAIADIEGHGMDLQSQEMMHALSLATGMSQDQAQNILGAVGTGTQRQTAIATIALQQLQGDREWQMFLSEFGLKHDQVMEMLRQGRVDQALKLAELFLKQAATTSEGTY